MLEQKEAPDFLYHYTDLNAVVNIFDKGELWLTNVGFMNDPTEYSEGRSYLQEKLNEFVANVTEGVTGNRVGYNFEFIDELFDRPAYLTSFSTENDLLSQWRGYCPGGGYALEFGGQDLATSVSKHSDCLMLVCDYDISEQKEYLNSVVLELIKIITYLVKYGADNEKKLLENINNMNLLVLSTLIHKNRSYFEENEVRLACQSVIREKRFRVKNSVLMPYVTVDFDVNSISKIIIGPMSQQELAKEGLLHFLKSLVNNEKHHLKRLPEVEVSKIPLRLI